MGKRPRLSFEEALTHLEETVQRLEAGDLTLEEATRLYADGMGLARLCNELLTRAELTVTRLQTSYGEQMRFLAGDGEEAATTGDSQGEASEPDA